MCKHEMFLDSLGEPQTNREYWIMTEIFVYLHNGKDACDCGCEKVVNEVKANKRARYRFYLSENS